MNTRKVFGRKSNSRATRQSQSTTTVVPPANRPHRVHNRSITANLQDLAFAPMSQVEQDTLLRQHALESAQSGKYTVAIALFNLLIEQNPNSTSDYNNRGLLYFQNGQLEYALADYNCAIQLNPRLAKVYNNRANCYAVMGELEAAIADYETAIDLNPANIHARLNQGITFRDLGNYSQAIESLDLALQFSQMLQSNQTSNIYLEGHIYAERGRTHHLAGDWNCAVADYQRAFSHLPLTASPNTATSYRLRLQVEMWLDSLGLSGTH